MCRPGVVSKPSDMNYLSLQFEITLVHNVPASFPLGFTLYRSWSLTAVSSSSAVSAAATLSSSYSTTASSTQRYQQREGVSWVQEEIQIDSLGILNFFQNLSS